MPWILKMCVEANNRCAGWTFFLKNPITAKTNENKTKQMKTLIGLKGRHALLLHYVKLFCTELQR